MAIFALLLAQAVQPSIFTYFSDSNAAGRVIVIALGVLSLGAWTIMIGKYLDLMRLRRLNGVFERELNRVGSVVDVDTRSGRVSRGGPFARLMVEGVNACRS